MPWVYWLMIVIDSLHFLLYNKNSVQIVLSMEESALTDVSSDQRLPG